MGLFFGATILSLTRATRRASRANTVSIAVLRRHPCERFAGDHNIRAPAPDIALNAVRADASILPATEWTDSGRPLVFRPAHVSR